MSEFGQKTGKGMGSAVAGTGSLSSVWGARRRVVDAALHAHTDTHTRRMVASAGWKKRFFKLGDDGHLHWYKDKDGMRLSPRKRNEDDEVRRRVSVALRAVLADSRDVASLAIAYVVHRAARACAQRVVAAAERHRSGRQHGPPA